MRVAALLSAASTVTLSALLAGCSSAGPASAGGPKGGGPVSGDETWSDGMQLSSSVTIDAGSTVTIAAGATITAAAGVVITVQGTLKAAGGAEAKITSTQAWGGILVDKNGTLSLTNVDLDNASSAVSVNVGSVSATYDKGTISASAAPFAIQGGAKLTTDHATVKGSLGSSRVQGELHATYLDYDANGNDGITAEADGAVVFIEDSELHGIGGNSDMIVSYQGVGTLHVAYTEIKNVHCGFHIERATNIDVSHVTSASNSFGAMLYGSLATGTRTFDAVNFDGELEWGIDEEDGDVNGPITITGSYFGNNTGGDVHLQTATRITVTGNATAALTDAHPR
jgi:hypothetical protein